MPGRLANLGRVDDETKGGQRHPDRAIPTAAPRVTGVHRVPDAHTGEVHMLRSAGPSTRSARWLHVSPRGPQTTSGAMSPLKEGQLERAAREPRTQGARLSAEPEVQQPELQPKLQPEIQSEIQSEIQESDADLVQLLDATTDGILIHRGLRYVYANAAALKLLGRAREEVLGHSPFDLVPPRFRLLLAERVMEVFATHTPMPEVEERLLHASGAEVPVEVIDIPIRFGGSVATLVHVRDITARRALEIRLRAADRLASASLIAAGVVHEISNPLAFALANLEHLEEVIAEECSARSRARDVLGVIRSNVLHAAHVARDASVFAHERRVRATHVDVREVLEASIAFLGPDLRSRANVIERYQDVPRVLGDRARLAQVFLNLLTISVQSLSHGSRRPNDVTITVRPKDSAVVVVTIADTGNWRPQELECAMFEPLFTTRTNGTGVTLALSKELLSSEGGELSVDSTLGCGTTFTVTLPAACRDGRATPHEQPARAVGKRILVVDDEPRVASRLKTILCEHKTTIARSGHEALQRLHSGEAYDLIVCDLLVENIDGIELYRRIREEWPGLHTRIIFLTGDAFISRTQEFLATIPNRHLQTPFEHDELLDVVDDVLASDRRA
ncbi:MAG TPA: ATP-binding protein [Labilithrix sp.]|nr:ATP-binding protein [Labilithrix sp.]